MKNEEFAAAVDMNEIYAAIALAMHEHASLNVHDEEAHTITIREHPTQWNAYALSMNAIK